MAGWKVSLTLANFTNGSTATIVLDCPMPLQAPQTVFSETANADTVKTTFLPGQEVAQSTLVVEDAGTLSSNGSPANDGYRAACPNPEVPCAEDTLEDLALGV